MKRLMVSVFLLLYAYNFAGYLVVFSYMQYRVRSEMQSMLKERVPESELTVLSFHTPSLECRVSPIQWLDQNEFQYAGGMYDVVRSRVSGDSTYFFCVNDVQEENLFVNLNDHVQRHTEDSREQTNLDSFKDVFKESNIHLAQYSYQPTLKGLFVSLPIHEFASITLDVPFPPPRLQSAC